MKLFIKKKISQFFNLNQKNRDVPVHDSFKKNLYEMDQNTKQNDFLRFINDKQFKFTDDWITYKTNIMLNIFENYNINPKEILEIGVHEGFSTIFFQYAFKDFHTDVIDIFLNDTRKKFESNINIINLKNIDIHQTTSHNFLVNNKKKYDLIFVDGGHGYLDVIFDLFYSFQCLHINGLLLIDDYDWKEENKDKSVRLATNNFLDVIEGSYEAIHQGQFAAIIKKKNVVLNQQL